MIPTKTYPLSAIMGEEMTDKERIAELEAEATMRREQAEGLQNQWVKDTQKIVALETEVKMLRKDAERYWCLRDNFNFAITQNRGYDWINLIFADEIDAAIDAARDGK